MPDENPNNLTPEQQAEQERLRQEQARQQRPQIHSRPRELAKKAGQAYKHGSEFVADPRAKAQELGKMAKDRALKPIQDAQDIGRNAVNSGRNAVSAVRNAPQNIAKKAQETADKGKRAVETVRNAPANIAKSATDTLDKGKKAVEAVKRTPENIKKGVDAAKAGAQAVKVGLQAGKAAGGLLAKGGLKAAVGAAVGAPTAGVGTAVLAAGDAAAAAAKAGVKAGRKVLKQFNADLIGKIEDKVWDSITTHFKKYWKAYLAGAFVMPTLIFVTAFMIIFLAFNRGFDKDSPMGKADITSFQSAVNLNILIQDDQKDELISQIKEGMVSPRLLKFLNTIGKNHKVIISAVRDEVEDDPSIKFDPVQINIKSVDSIKCSNSKTNQKYKELPIPLSQGFDWKSLIPSDEDLKEEIICAIDYYPLLDSPKVTTEPKLYEIFSPQEFPISTLESSGLAAAQIKIAELLIEADNYMEDDEGITLAPASMELDPNFANKNYHNPSDISLRNYFKTRANKNIEDVDSLFQSPSSLEGGALVFFL